MAKKFGDDRSRDKHLDTDMDLEEMDRLSMDDPFGGSFGVDDSGGGRKPASATKRMVTEGAKGMAKGALTTLGQEVERNMPNLWTVKSEISDTYSDLREMKDEISKELQPMMISMENTARKILPRVNKLMPKSWYNKISKTLEDRAAERSGGGSRSKEQERADLISSELGQLFSQQQLETNKHNEFEHHKEKIMDRAISSTQHKATQRAMVRIYDSVRSTELFHRTLHTAYMKKSLELQYKHLFVAQDTHNLMAKSMDAFEAYFKAIVKNTSLPDVMKVQASDYIKKARTEKYGTMMSDYLTNARRMIFDKIKTSVKDALGNLNFAAQGLEMGADSLNMMDEMAELNGGAGGTGDMLAGGLGKLLGWGLSSGPIGTILGKLSPYLNVANGEMDNFKTRAYMGMDKLRSKWIGSSSWWKSAIASFLPSLSAPTTGSNDLLTRSEEAAAFDKLTRQSIVEIIPGYLGKILHSVDKMRLGENAPEMTYNIFKRDFTTSEQFSKDIFASSHMFGGNEGSQTSAIGEAFGALKTGFKSKNEDPASKLDNLEGPMSRFIANLAYNNGHFEPTILAQFADDPNKYAEDDYIKMASDGIEHMEFYRLVRTIVDGLRGNDNKFNRLLVRKFADAIHGTRTNADASKVGAAKFNEHYGLRRFMTQYFNTDGTLNKTFATEYLARHGKRKDIESVADWTSDRIGEEAKDREFVSGKFNNSWIGQQVLKGYNKYQSWSRGSSDELDQVRIGPNGVPEKIEVTKAHKEMAKYLQGGQGVIDIMPTVAAQSDEHRKAIEAYIDDVNKRFDAIDEMEVDEKTKIGLRRRASIELVQKHAKIVGILIHAKRGQTINTVLGVADKILPKSVSEKLNGPEYKEGGIKAVFKSMKDSVKKTLLDIEKKLPKNEKDVEKQVEQISEICDNVVKETPKNRQQVLAKLEQIRENFKKNHPEAAKKIDALIKDARKRGHEWQDAVENNEHVQAIWGATKAYGSYIQHAVDPFMEQGKQYISDKAEEAKGFGYKQINRAMDKMGLDKQTKKLCIKALHGDRKAIEQLRLRSPEALAKLESLVGLNIRAGEEGTTHWQRLKNRMTSAFTSAKSQATETWGDITEKAEELGEDAGDYFSGLKSNNATKPDSTLMELLNRWSETSSAEHNMIFDLVGVISDQLKKGVATVNGGTIETAGKGTYVASDKDLAALIRKRYGIFGKGGYMIGQGFRKLGSGLWGTTKKLGSFYWKGTKKLYHAGGSVLGGLWGGAKRIGGWISNTTGLNPYVDIYVRGQEDKRPILTMRKQAFGKGVVFGVKDGDGWKPGTERVMSSPDIVKKGVPIFDPETGNCLIGEEELAKGLWAHDGTLAQIGRMSVAAIRGTLGIYGKAIQGVVEIGKIAAKGIFGTEEDKYCDIYRKGEVDGNPLVTRRQQMKPGIFFVKSGDRVERSSDIHEPVMDKNKQVLIRQEDIDHGLVDVHNKPLGSSMSAAREGLLGGAFKLGGIIAKGIFGETGMKIAGGIVGTGLAMYKGLFSALLGGAGSVGRGIANLGARIFGFDTKDGFGRKAFDGLNSRLDQIIKLVSAIANHSGGTMYDENGMPTNRGREGYWDKNGNFHPRKGGNSYEFDGPDHPGGAKRARENAKQRQSANAAGDYREKTWDPVTDGEGGSGEEGSSWTDTALDALMYSDMIPLKWRRKLIKMKHLPKKLKIKSIRAARKLKGVVKGGVKSAIRGAGRLTGKMRAARQARVMAKSARLAKTARLARMGRMGKLAGLLRLGGLAGKVGGVGAATAGAVGASRFLPAMGKLAGLGRFAGAAGKFLGPAASIALAAYDAYNGWNNAASYLGKNPEDVTTGEKTAGAVSNAWLNGMTLGIAPWLAKKIYGEDTDLVAEGTKVMSDGEGWGNIGHSIWNWFTGEDEKKAEEIDKNEAAKAAKSKALLEAKIECIRTASKGYDVGAITSATVNTIVDGATKSGYITRDELMTAAKENGGYWTKDADLVKKITNYIHDTYPPASDDPKGRFDYFKKMYDNPDRASLNKNILRLFGVTNPHDAGQWEQAYKTCKSSADSNGKGPQMDTTELPAGAKASQPEDIYSKPPIDVTQMLPPNKEEISSTDFRRIQAEAVTSGTNRVVDAVRSSNKQAPLTEAEMQTMLKQNQVALMGYSKFAEAFSGLIGKDGLKISGMTDLQAITAAKSVESPTQIINNTIVQTGDEGVDMRKKQG